MNQSKSGTGAHIELIGEDLVHFDAKDHGSARRLSFAVSDA
mgnify:CR=1 FL=1